MRTPSPLPPLSLGQLLPLGLDWRGLAGMGGAGRGSLLLVAAAGGAEVDRRSDYSFNQLVGSTVFGSSKSARKHVMDDNRAD